MVVSAVVHSADRMKDITETQAMTLETGSNHIKIQITTKTNIGIITAISKIETIDIPHFLISLIILTNIIKKGDIVLSNLFRHF
jgi:DNA-directed RNA polymerase alpha subunit